MSIRAVSRQSTTNNNLNNRQKQERGAKNTSISRNLTARLKMIGFQRVAQSIELPILAIDPINFVLCR
ncbi:MAG: hypothetical protein GPOALKHO_001788 [Sodalis sp.]|nr:MAG: hypothetical protein GPOALKHO_001788 [Sodalis sp.]